MAPSPAPTIAHETVAAGTLHARKSRRPGNFSNDQATRWQVVDIIWEYPLFRASGAGGRQGLRGDTWRGLWTAHR